MNKEISKKLDEIKSLLLKQNTLKKDILDTVEASEFLGISPSCIYKLTSNSELPYYKPNGKKIYFKRTELEEWMLQNRCMSMDEIQENAENFFTSKN